MPHPCFGKDLRSATRIAAFADIVWTSIFIAIAIVIIIGCSLTFIVQHQEPASPSSNNSASTFNTEIGTGGDDITKLAPGGLMVGTILLIVKILQLLLAVYLFQAASERNPHKCKIWIYITCVFVIITVLNFLFDVISVEGSKTGSYISIIGIMLHIYFLWIVFAYKQELETGRAQPKSVAVVCKS